MGCYCTGVGIVLDKALDFSEYKELLSRCDNTESTLFNKYLSDHKFKKNINHAFLEAISDAGLCLKELKNNERIGLVIGSSLGFIDQSKDEPKRIMDFSWLIRKYRFKGSVYIISNTCTSSLNAITTAINMLNADKLDICIVGGVDVAGDFINYGFQSLNLLNKNNEIHLFNENDTGTFLTNASCFLVLNKYRKSRFYTEVLAGAIKNEAFDLTRIENKGQSLYKAVYDCLKKANITINQIDILMTCANGIKKMDSQQNSFFQQYFPKEFCTISTVKNLIGHTLGASTILDIISIIAFIHNGKIQTIKGEWINRNVKYVLILSIGFAGVNGTILLRFYDKSL